MDSVTNQNHSQQTIYYANGSVLGQIVHSKVSHEGGVKQYRAAHNGEGYVTIKEKTKNVCK